MAGNGTFQAARAGRRRWEFGLQSAWGVAREGLALAQEGQTCPPDQLVPAYHRLSQAERERLAREKAAPAPQNQ